MTPTAGVRVSANRLTLTEAPGSSNAGTYTVALASQPSGPVGGVMSEVKVTPASLTFTTASWATAQTVTASAVDDVDRVHETVRGRTR